MSLFEFSVPGADQAYVNIRAAEKATERSIRDALEDLWSQYRPYADTNFPQKFAVEPDARFWEMYLTTQLLAAGKNVRPRSELDPGDQDLGPDIRVVERGRTIWIEASAPRVGDPRNPDRVPEIVPISEGGEAQLTPRREVELRISGALKTKRDVFERYRSNGIVADDDICLVAISGAHFTAQSGSMQLPLGVTAVYPLGEGYVTFDRETLEVVDSGFVHTQEIERSDAGPIPRSSFLSEHFSRVSGLIWSRRTIGNFFFQESDFVFVHNFAASISLPLNWLGWAEEDVVADDVGGQLRLTRLTPEEREPM